MESLIACHYCHKSMAEDEALKEGWLHVNDQWEHEPIKVWDIIEKQYKYYPRCVAKQLKRGTTVTPVKI